MCNFPMTNSKSWRVTYISTLRSSKSNFVSSTEIWQFTTTQYVSCDGNIHGCCTTSYVRTFSADTLYLPREYLTRLILFCDLTLFHTSVCDTDVEGHIRSERAFHFFSKFRLIRALDQFLEWISATRPGQIFWAGFIPTRCTHLCLCMFKKKKNISSQLVS